MFELLNILHENVYKHLATELTWLKHRDLSAAFELMQYPNIEEYMNPVWNHPCICDFLKTVALKSVELEDNKLVKTLYSLRCILLEWHHPAITSVYQQMLSRAPRFSLETHIDAVIIARVLRDYSLIRLVLTSL